MQSVKESDSPGADPLSAREFSRSLAYRRTFAGILLPCLPPFPGVEVPSGGLVLGSALRFQVLQRCPEEADEFPGDRDSGDGSPTPRRGAGEEPVHPVLCLPGVCDHVRGLSLLAALQCGAH